MKNSTIKIDLNWVKDFVIRLKIFFNPSYWIMNHPYSAEWDKELNDLMGEHDFKKHSDYYSFLGDKKIWVQNHPYASFTRDYQRPSRITIYKANEKLKSDRDKFVELYTIICTFLTIVPENIRKNVLIGVNNMFEDDDIDDEIDIENTQFSKYDDNDE
jgi:hypothetical protein